MKMWYVHTVEYYSAVKNEILWFIATWMELEDMMLGKVSQEQKAKYDMVSHVESTKKSSRKERVEQWFPDWEIYGWVGAGERKANGSGL
jgi:hypothetical protein